MSIDTLSDVLAAVRLQGAVFFDVRASAPWVASAPPSEVLAPAVMPGAEHVIEYHAVSQGVCWANIKGEEPIRLDAGDVVVFPQGDAHIMASDKQLHATAPPPDLDGYARPVGGQLPVLISEGGGGEPAHLVCGFLGCDARPFNPLLAALPRMLLVRGGGGLIDHFIRMAVTESSERRTGGECVLARLAELMFVEIVRRHLHALPSEKTGWLAGLRDEFVGRSLAFLHQTPSHDWSLDELSSKVGLSRSSLAERFMHFVGTPPMQYLAQWRMQVASGLLAHGSASIAEIGLTVGYGSEAAFSRAFKKMVGVPPAAWRGRRRAES